MYVKYDLYIYIYIQKNVHMIVMITLQGTITYPTEGEVRNIIDSNMPYHGGICDRSLEGM